MPNQIPRNILPNASFTPAVFKGNVFTPQQADMRLLASSLDKIEEREEKLATQRLALGEAFSKARELLPDNEETNKYITDSQNKIRDNINAMVNIGDYSGALNSARRLAGDFISSPEYNARVKEHKQRKEWLSQLDSTNVDNYIKDYYKHLYSDKNNFTRDDKGNITGTAGWEAPLPEQGQSASAIIQMAVKTTAEERTDTANTWTDATGTGGHHGNKRETLTAEKISSTAKSLLKNNPRLKQSFIDQFNAGIYQIKKLGEQVRSLTEELARTTDPDKVNELNNTINSINNQIDGYKASCYKNSAPISNAEEYINNIFSSNNSEIKNAAYDYRHSNTGSDNYVKGKGDLTPDELANRAPGSEQDRGGSDNEHGQNTKGAGSKRATLPSKVNRNDLLVMSWN